MLKNKHENSGFNYMREINRYPAILDQEKNAQLFKQWQKSGDKDIYHQLVYGNYKLVFSIARKYKDRGMDFLDLYQEGFMGLVRALKTFDPKKGSLSTYATDWIRAKIVRALADKARTVRITVHTESKMFFINRFVNSFYDEQGYHPTDREVYDRIHALDDTDKKTTLGKKITLENVRYCRILHFYSIGEASLNTTITSQNIEGGGTTLGDAVADSKVNLEAEVEVSRLQKAVLERVKYRTKENLRTLTVVYLRFELGQTLADAGRRLGISRARVGQIEAQLITKIAHDLKTNKKCIREILTKLPLGIDGEKLNIPENILPKTFSTTDLFKILCEHLILTPSDQRIVKEPMRTLQTRESLLPDEAEAALEKMRAGGLIQGEAPWNVILILPKVDMPQYKN